MKNYTYISKSENDTKQLAMFLASKLNTGDTLVLSGDLGSGKTKFTEGFLSYFNLEDEISSPTFTIVNEYKGGSVPFYHFDVYRISDDDELYAMGFDDYVQNGICVVEWSENIPDSIPGDAYRVTIERVPDDENGRKITIERDEK